ncbi:MAG: HAMP domain-containing sensor histidine kinase [Cyclobacteriaceae bacterium]|jgi:signal transduction histidine kinase|nr:HAMP domain-containing sensor histidine kinase [Cyclobacteriaceae bacterium]
MSRLLPTMNLYTSQARWKWIVLLVSVCISSGSIWYTNVLVNQLKEQEKEQIQLYAKTLEYTVNENDASGDNINFITQEILFQNNSIPIIIADEKGEVLDYRNIDVDTTLSKQDITKFLKGEIETMRKQYEPIKISLIDNGQVFAVQYIYYENSFLLTQLIAYPYIQLSVIAIFAIISYLAFNYSKEAEQNRLWVGLAKETAHQLGTPLSSLMAWMEVLRDDANLREKGIVDELEKDVKKLTIVTERFSSIGSVPVLKQENVVQLVNNVVQYLRPRISSKVRLEVYTLSESIYANVHAPLFEWVIENLCKNAVDAMGSSGLIAIKILRGSESKVLIDISDTGKGIPRSKIPMVFNPGFTTKKRGWGLGLALAKRIIESYHNGQIFVKSSEENQGTTFRIVLKAITATI